VNGAVDHAGEVDHRIGLRIESTRRLDDGAAP
jgi:hypothetical protein